ncbi:diacylglycerol O-acyltransferase 1 [Didymosphaeria variabile]|uniref:diacylglycerol O-acyltransferase n=1 Tax=Didymosphaeria variabile TaxID=1932322 RepID=A0A9W8X9W1_9PLEO|nr:diacylglycerol O-acyltransferase 1 [Didymosphaeria variabile]KAJ4344675.1 diacylglycerol O-acyltransferase 1 [Didymosphaeria variabile]
MSLNAEPSQPEERADHNLAPKSYAAAAEEALQNEPEPEAQSHESQTDGALDDAKDALKKKVRDHHKDNQTNGTKVIRIVPAEEYEGEGQDNSPKSPSRNSHRRKSSLKSNGSIGRKYGEQLQYEMFEKHKDGNGDALTSVKPTADFELETRTDKKPMRRNSELKSGRQAGEGWHKSKIRFAPLNVPLQRRLQTLAVLLHTLSIAGLVSIFFFLCAIPILWPILLPYLIYVLFSKAGESGELSFRSDRWRKNKIWSLFASYFPARLHRSQELEPTRKYIFGYHPHGIISHGAFAAFATEALGFSQLFPGITNTLLTLDGNFKLPLYREYALRMGLASVSRESCENILSKGGPNNEGMGRAITIVIGGARESLESKPGTLRLVLRRRLGFVKLGIRKGADLVPVIGFGENEIYEQLDPHAHPYINKFQLLIKKLMGWTIPLFHARGIFNYDVGMMPYRRPMNIVVGRPIKVVQQQQPDKEYIEKVHEEYITELLRMWNDHKDQFAKERMEELKIIE